MEYYYRERVLSMPLSHTANTILYVPFSKEYTVPFEKINKLDTNTFFRECYVRPRLNKTIEQLEHMVETEIPDFEYPLRREDFIRKYEDDKIRRASFLDWIDGSGDGIYLLRGDAGTGKTTYVHYLKWKYTSIDWKILDIRRATERISLIGQKIKFQNFYSLHGKAIACILDKLLSMIFVKANNANSIVQYDFDQTFEQIQILLQSYRTKILPMEPLDEYGVLYRSLNAIEVPEVDEKREYCRECARLFASYFMKNCSMNDDLSDALECAITHYMIILRCFKGTTRKKTIIVIDNIERFIGVHEIFSNELIKFLRHLRRIVDNYEKDFFHKEENRNLFAENFQFIISMRNTSARGFTPKQNADFFEGSVDLSEWFSIGEIINNKIEWFENNGYTIENDDRFKYIMNDFGIAEEGIVRGLRPKLNLIFNFNKRLTVEFLSEILESTINKEKLNIADELRLKRLRTSSTNGGLASFAYRSVIWRLLMDKLNQGGMFRYIFSKKNSAEESSLDMDYIRNILTILSNYTLENGEQYMPLESMVTNLYHLTDSPATWFDNWTWAVERKKNAQLLFYMNYYNRRENNWFQFIDIQCNDASYDKVHFEKWEDILEMIETKNKFDRKIGVRITNAGKAYIGYIAQTFEFISCLEDISMPLLCTLPTEQDLLNAEISKLPCIQIIEKVSQRVSSYIKDDDVNIKYEYGNPLREYSYTNRLINSHIGYLDNFIACVENSIKSEDEKIQRKKGELIAKIKSITDNYRKRVVD